MKKIVKKILPDSVISDLKFYHNKLKLVSTYYNDLRRFNNAAYNLNKKNTLENHRAKITFYSHSLEKGMTNVNFRYGFGKTALINLFDALDEFVNRRYPLSDRRYATAISTLEEYISIHEKNNYDVTWVKEELNKLPKPLHDHPRNIGGAIEFTKETMMQLQDMSFPDLAENRFSVRDFSEEPVNQSLIEGAIQIAMKTPSVCNRQSSYVYVIKNKQMIGDILKLQGGLNGFGQNIDSLMMVTSDNSYLSNFHERNQTFIDGGMFSMSLIYALTSKGIASCPLNADLYPKNEKEIREITKIRDSENIIMFIAMGNYPNNFKVAKSHRDTYADITRVLE